MEPQEIAPGRAWTDDQLASIARDLVLAMMASATTEKISPIDWWPRAKAALCAAAARAASWGEVVQTMATKLEIGTLRMESSKAICSLALTGADLRTFRRIVQTQAVYIVAEAQVIREQERAAKGVVA